MSAHSIFSEMPESSDDRPWVLAIDFGTTTTTGVMADASGVEVLEVDGSRLVPSAVFLAEDGQLIAGAGAAHQGLVQPDRIERTPKRCVGSESIVLGGEAVRVVDAVAAVLSLVLAEAVRRRGGQPTKVCLTHPASWEQERKRALLEAAQVAGLPRPALMAEPVAAAVHLAGDRLTPGAVVAVYDLGGGTFDAAVLRRTDDEFELAGTPGGIDELGGEDFDRAVYAHFGAVLAAEAPEAWKALQTSEDRPWRRASADLLGESRRAKEALSRQGSYTAYIPSPVDRELRITRAELDDLIREQIAATVDELEGSIKRASSAANQLAGVYLVGGSSRMPLVATVVAERLGRVPETRDDPKAVVALGAAEAIVAHMREAAATEAVENAALSTIDADAPTPAKPLRPKRKGRARRVAIQALTSVAIIGMLAVGVIRSQNSGPATVKADPAGNNKPVEPTTTTTTVSAEALEQRRIQAEADAAARKKALEDQIKQAAADAAAKAAAAAVAAGQRNATPQQGSATGTATASPGANGPAINSVYQTSEQSSNFWGTGAYWFKDDTGLGGFAYTTYSTPRLGDDCGGGSANSVGHWQSALPASGRYRVDVHIPSVYATTTNARYNVVTSSGNQPVQLDQSAHRGSWVTLGTWHMNNARVDLSDVTGDACGTTYIAFDDVRWVYQGS
jgi:cell division ATPase FtsA